MLLTSKDQPGERIAVAAVRGGRAAFTALVAAYQSDLVRVSYVILGDASLAEDAAQSAWIKAWRKLGQLRDDHKVRSWLVAVAANEARQIARRKRPLVAPPSTSMAYTGVDPGLTDLAAAIAQLEPDERRLLSLRYVAELTSNEIGEALGLSAGAVRHRLMRLLARLKQELDR